MRPNQERLKVTMEKEIVGAINASPYKAYVTATGGGSSFVGKFLEFGGGSATILGFNVPYATGEFIDFIGGAPDKFVSPDAARKLAVASFEKACKHTGRDHAVGIGCSASLKKSEERKGRKHFIFVAYHTAKITRTIQLELCNPHWNRSDQEKFCAKVILLTLAEVCELPVDWKVAVGDNAYCEVNKSHFLEVSKALDEGRSFMIPNLQAEELLKQEHVVLFPGSFNPLHHGHMEIYEFIKKFLGVTPIFEISVTNVDKPMLSYFDIVERWNEMGDLPLVLTDAPLMFDKISLFKRNIKYIQTAKSITLKRDLTVVMGLDTWDRFARPPYDTEANIEFLKKCTNLNFIVSNRPTYGVTFKKKDGLNATFIPGLSVDVSSKQIRKARK